MREKSCCCKILDLASLLLFDKLGAEDFEFIAQLRPDFISHFAGKCAIISVSSRLCLSALRGEFFQIIPDLSTDVPQPLFIVIFQQMIDS